ncbi:MAG: DEAD/DEAH box helicase [Corynebacterium sp.]|uniref:DEAD/DEAH box helicase n=1 Tax=Corynebacterium sp. TaxID=1720 RepID=UPI0026DA885C|nr:DEAD/DEAH box helicase [Corynebacterium sp.]MDO4760330.1 DEAD/DEAH box helicase [Corynebacterium sp.]
MDRNRLNALRNRAAALNSMLPALLALQADLTSDRAAQVSIPHRISIESAKEYLYLIDPATVAWPHGLYVRAELLGTHSGIDIRANASEVEAGTSDNLPECFVVLSALIEKIQPLGQLYRDSQHAADGFFGKLMRGGAVERAQLAAEELEQRLMDPHLLELDTQARFYLQRAADAHRKQQAGVSLTTTDYPEAVHAALCEALDVRAPKVDTLDRSYIYPAVQLVARIHQCTYGEPMLAQAATQALARIRAERAEVLIKAMPLEKLKDVTNERLRFQGVEHAGIFTVYDVYKAPLSALTQISGIGVQTASRMKAAAQTLYTEAATSTDMRIGNEPTQAAMELVRVLATYAAADTLNAEQKARRERLLGYFTPVPTLSPTGAPFIMLSNSPALPSQFLDDLAWAGAVPDSFLPPEPTPISGDTAWADYLTRPAHYQSLLHSLVGAGDYSTDLGLDDDTLQAIRELRLNDSLLKDLYLRGYQSFGAKFAIVRAKTVLGDEMGLGKTVQALAVAAHIAADGGRIVCVVPASLIVNWARETAKFTHLDVHIGHGDAKQLVVDQWAENGGMLIVTYEGARSLTIPKPALVIVDEAHMVKNPSALRSKACARLIAEADCALLMTGTPIENRIGEFVQLIRYVQPELVAGLDQARSPQAFRKQVAPAYLRRNQKDVLDELPQKIESVEWVELSTADHAEYADAIAQGHWMKARRAAFVAPSPMSAKVERIREIVEEATAEQRNVLIFSYFRDVLSRLESELGARCVGVISGDVPPAGRQTLVDALGQSGNVLLAQIGAGGVGLNIQKASVVILAEVQVKPSLEDQAIARAHRMGQTEVVQVYRMVGDETVDEILLDVTAGKRKIFDEYARVSEVGEIPDAIDVSESKLAAFIIHAERERLGLLVPSDDQGVGENAQTEAVDTREIDSTADASDTESTPVQPDHKDVVG